MDGKIYFGDDNGDVSVLALDRTKKVIARNELDVIVRAAPVYANGVLYVLRGKILFALAQKP